MSQPRRSKYDIVVNMEIDDVHSREVRWVGRGKTVLECGCDTGYVSKVLTEQYGCRVIGVELDPVAAEAARAHCEQVLVADLDTFDPLAALGDRRVDVVLLGDVLEHLKEPWALLERLRAVLAPAGRVIACVPNVAHRNVVLNLVLGDFEYRERGLLDVAHLRMFTARSLRAMFERAGYVVARFERIENEEVAQETPVDLRLFPRPLLEFLRQANPEWRTLQFLVEAFPATEAGTLATLRARLADGDAAGRAEEGRPREAWLESAAGEGMAWADLLRELLDRERQLRAQADALASERDRRAAHETELGARLEAVTARLGTAEETVRQQQEGLTDQVRAVEMHWRERVEAERQAQRERLDALAASESVWRQRAHDYETYWRRVREQPVVRALRHLRSLARRALGRGSAGD